MKGLAPSSRDQRVVDQRRIAGLILKESYFSPEFKLHNHTHEATTFCLALSGGCTETFVRQTRLFNQHHLGYLPADEEHSFMVHQSGMRSFMIEYPRTWLERVREYASHQKQSAHFMGGPLNWLMVKLYQEFRNGDQSALVIEGLALEIFGEVSRFHRARNCHHRPLWLDRAEEFMRSRFSEPLRLEQIARVAEVHPMHLAREFRRYNQSSVGAYLRRVRIDFIANQLVSSDVPLAELALTAGFSDQSHLARTFKRHLGVSPSTYRSSFRRR